MDAAAAITAKLPQTAHKRFLPKVAERAGTSLKSGFNQSFFIFILVAAVLIE